LRWLNSGFGVLQMLGQLRLATVCHFYFGNGARQTRAMAAAVQLREQQQRWQVAVVVAGQLMEQKHGDCCGALRTEAAARRSYWPLQRSPKMSTFRQAQQNQLE